MTSCLLINPKPLRAGAWRYLTGYYYWCESEKVTLQFTSRWKKCQVPLKWKLCGWKQSISWPQDEGKRTNLTPSRRNTSKRDHGRPLAGQCGKEFAHLWAGKTKIVAWLSMQQKRPSKRTCAFFFRGSLRIRIFKCSFLGMWCIGRVQILQWVDGWLYPSIYGAVWIHPVVF